MDTDKTTLPVAAAAADGPEDAGSFTTVKSKKSQKRKREAGGADMETEGPGAPKRPQFPAISSDKLRVSTPCVLILCEVFHRVQVILK